MKLEDEENGCGRDVVRSEGLKGGRKGREREKVQCERHLTRIEPGRASVEVGGLIWRMWLTTIV